MAETLKIVFDDVDDELKGSDEFIRLLICECWVPYVCREPSASCRMSIGHKWVQEILATSGQRCRDVFRMDRNLFFLLCRTLVDQNMLAEQHNGVHVEEMVGMFLITVGHGVPSGLLRAIFRHSTGTVSEIFHLVLEACVSLSHKNVKACDPGRFREIHRKIRRDKRFHPYFRNAIGAIDGTHIQCVPPPGENRSKYIGKKHSHPTQNVMAVCDWDMCFTFLLAGWHGSVHDNRVFHYAVSQEYFPHPPQGKYYLVDVSYSTPIGYLGPYRPPHQPAFTRANKTFNSYHSRLRLTIERTFGVWKKRFQILNKIPPYDYGTQIKIVSATMALHNFIRRNSEEEVDDVDVADNDSDDDDDEPPGYYESNEMSHTRDQIREQIMLYRNSRQNDN